MNFYAKSGVCSSKNGQIIALGTKENTTVLYLMTQCQIRPIFTFKFSIFVFFQKSKEDLVNDLVLCFNNFSIMIKTHKNRNNYFWLP